jgi:aldehyde:ferredoxin oxidoreductase
MHGWTGKILRVDLTNRQVTTEDDTDYADKFIGGIGFGAKVFWEEVPPSVKAFDPENKLAFMCGPATGSAAPSSGRVEIFGIAPQGYPHEHFSRSGVGGRWGDELKYAGYDGLIVEGEADKPVYLWIQDDKVEFRDAADIWGQGSFNTFEMIEHELGGDVPIAAIGQAGENLVRIATIQMDLGNAAGQGGFGAVMGSKNLKAIAVRGSGRVTMAEPEKILDLWKGIQSFHGAEYKITPEALAKYGSKHISCGANCPIACVSGYTHVPSPTGGLLQGWEHCAGFWMATPKTLETQTLLRNLANDLGLNEWECVYGLVQWAQYCANAGYLPDIGGTAPTVVPQDARAHPGQNPVVCCPDNTLESFVAIMKAIAFRDGDVGDTLAEGLGRACDQFGFGREFMEAITYKDGYPDHCGSRWKHNHPFPFWVWTALTYGVDYRDTSDDHGHALMHLDSYCAEYRQEGGLSWDQVNEVARHIWDSGPCMAPETGYDNKAKPAFWVQRDAKFWNSLIVCDSVFPMQFSLNDGGLARVKTPAGETYEGPDLTWVLYNYVTGQSIDAEERLKIGERIWNLERAIMVREGRTRKPADWYINSDESVIPYFVKWGDVRDGIHGDADELKRVFDEYYALVGWDLETGWPTREKYEELGLKDVADELESLDKLP